MATMTTPTPTDPLLTAREVAERLRLEYMSVLTGWCRHELPWLKVGQRLLVRESDLEAWLVRRQERDAA